MKFETINNQLCRMVEPTPLQLDSPLPCVVRYIQDCSPMGRYMKRKYAMVINTVAIVSRIGTDGRAYSSDKIFVEEVEVLEIIGYPVEEGSNWWALYQMMQGHEIINSNGTIPFCHHEDRILRCGDDISWDIDHWLRIYDDTRGWQLYEPQPEPEFAVGDWVEIEVSGVLSQQQATSGAFADSIKCGGVEFYANGNPVMQPLNARIIRKLSCHEAKRTPDAEQLEARIAEPEKPILCAKCNDHIIADDGAVCEICADTMDTIITELQTRNAELEAMHDHQHLLDLADEAVAAKCRIAKLEAALDKAAHQLYDYSGSCPSDLYDWEHPNTCIRECDRYDSPDEAWKCWRLWLMCPAPPEDK